MIVDKNIYSYDDDGNLHGYMESYWGNGNLACKGNYLHGKQVGYWRFYSYSGPLKNSVYFID